MNLSRVQTRRAKTLTTDMWPAFTTHTESDVIIAALSITRLVEWCGTPCVHTADAAIPGSGGRPSESELASVVAARVVSAEWRSDLRLHVVIDADLSGCDPTAGEARLLGRASDASPASVVLESLHPRGGGSATYLPADIAVGDLVIIPCRGVTLLHDIKA
ncbi:hypothetical protein [Conyzicola sp.]|uniref:hypothetical protein n=1 Tax=Conyzicola sp. TaxID=1969404 RepID=UPI003988EAC2